MSFIIDLAGEIYFEFSLLQWASALFIIFIATCVQVGTGIAFGLISAPLLAVIDLSFVPAPVLMLTFCTAITAVWGERKGIYWGQLKSALSGRITGSILGVLVLSLIPGDKEFMLIFGLTIAFAVFLSVCGLKIPFNFITIGLAGFISGFTAAITSVGGPPLAVVYQNQKSKDARPTLQSFFAVGAFLTLSLLAVTGHVTRHDIILALLLMPALLLGFIFGPVFRPFFDRNFRSFLMAVASVSALVLIWRGLS